MTDRPLSTNERLLVQLLASAHRRLDEQGVPHADPHPSNASQMLAAV